jgi:hypothetical protein
VAISDNRFKNPVIPEYRKSYVKLAQIGMPSTPFAKAGMAFPFMVPYA